MERPRSVPSSSKKILTVHEMYQYSVKQDESWVLSEYQSPKKYITSNYNEIYQPFDPKQKKVKPPKKVQGKYNPNAKRGGFLETLIKSKLKDPGPADKNINIKMKWSLGFKNIDFLEEQKKLMKIKGKRPLPDENAKRINFVDEEVTLHSYYDVSKKKRVPWPGPQDYFPKTEPLIVKGKKNKRAFSTPGKNHAQPKLPRAERVFFLSEDEYIGAASPGPGSYNPHPAYGVEKKYQKKEYTEFNTFQKMRVQLKSLDKEEKQKKKEEKSKIKEILKTEADFHPLPPDLPLFEHIRLKSEKTKKVKQKKGQLPEGKGFGMQNRFPKDEEELIKSKLSYFKDKGVETKVLQTPGPGFYELTPHWTGKPYTVKDKKGRKKLIEPDKLPNIFNKISTTPTKNIYYQQQK